MIFVYKSYKYLKLILSGLYYTVKLILGDIFLTYNKLDWYLMAL